MIRILPRWIDSSAPDKVRTMIFTRFTGRPSMRALSSSPPISVLTA
jgi:hypothetical protein